MGELGRQALMVAGEVGRLTKQLEEEEERGLVLTLKELHNKLARVEVAGVFSRQVGEEEGELQAKLVEEVQGGEVGGLLLLDVEGEEGVQIKQVAGEEGRLEGEEGGG